MKPLKFKPNYTPPENRYQYPISLYVALRCLINNIEFKRTQLESINPKTQSSCN